MDAIAELGFRNLLLDTMVELGLTPTLQTSLSDSEYAHLIQFQEALYYSSSSSIPPSIPPSSSSPSLPSSGSASSSFFSVSAPSSDTSTLSYGASTYNLQPYLPPCIICLETPHIFVPSQCSHLLCIPCLNEYVENKLRAKQIVISCAETGCEQALTLDVCEPFLTAALREMWGILLAEDSIPEGQRVYCPFQDCSVMHVKDMNNEDIASVECPSCHRLFCIRCMVPWHPDIGCSQYQRLPPGERTREDLLLQDLAKDKRWRRCSQCKHFIELNQGCNHMTCRCGNQFCYKCGAKWISNSHTCKSTK